MIIKNYYIALLTTFSIFIGNFNVILLYRIENWIYIYIIVQLIIFVFVVSVYKRVKSKILKEE